MTTTDRNMTRRGLLGGALGIAGAAGLSGCGLGTAGGFVPSGTLAGPLDAFEPLDPRPSVAVGSKNFSEQVLLGKMAVILLKAAGARVKDLTNIPGSSSSRQAMLNGDIQFSWEYTGTAWIAYLGHDEAIPDERKQYVAVAQEDLRRNQLVWLEPAPMNNTYGFAVKRQLAEQLGISRMSQLPQVPAARRTFCVESEFRNRNDGLEPMLKRYGVPLGSGVNVHQVKILDTGAIYSATNNGLCSFGEVFTTDGRIKALDLVVLEDDKSFFPKYNVCPVFRKEVLDANPTLADLFAPLTRALTDDVLVELNARIDVSGEEPVDVAWSWLRDQGFIEAR